MTYLGGLMMVLPLDKPSLMTQKSGSSQFPYLEIHSDNPMDSSPYVKISNLIERHLLKATLELSLLKFSKKQNLKTLGSELNKNTL